MHPESLETFATVARIVERTARTIRRPILLGIGGPGGCGKSTFSRWLHDRLQGAALFHLDDYRLPRADRAASGLLGSHPEGNDLAQIHADLDRALKGQPIQQPIFDPQAGRVLHSKPVQADRIWICDGEIAAHEPLRSRFDLFVLVHCHWRTQLNTRLTRDIRDRGHTLEKAIEIFLKSNLQDYPEFSKGAEQAAAIIVYRNTRGVFTLRTPSGP